jgi:putative NADH-flavin reductase
MRLFVIGATGHTGTEILDLARAHGHQITAFVRSPHKLQSLDGVTVVKGDPMRPEALAAAMAGHDAVLSTIGPSPREAMRPSTMMTDSGRAIVEAMTTSGVTRLVIASAAVLFPEKRLLYAFFRWFLRHHARDLSAMEQIVRTSRLAWTIARPPRLTGGHTVRYRAEANAMPRGARFSLTHRSVAAFMLEAIEHRSHVTEIVGLG